MSDYLNDVAIIGGGLGVGLYPVRYINAKSGTNSDDAVGLCPRARIIGSEGSNKGL